MKRPRSLGEPVTDYIHIFFFSSLSSFVLENPFRSGHSTNSLSFPFPCFAHSIFRSAFFITFLPFSLLHRVS
ncbi:hypothetical protein Csa_007785 [Cucumis sativus]|uniref:Uncharacterized protein n=1 Tax=Cucumis sativus TaxID=3659 RepID=A0A0A0KRB1_CUCSA|nr:hypothetical protein Csa_007785 [Cucumis sativus]